MIKKDVKFNTYGVKDKPFNYYFCLLFSVFEAFGPIIGCGLVPDPTKPGKHK